MPNLKKSISTLFLVLIAISSFAQITVDTSLSTQELVQDVLISSTCIETSNFTSFTGIDDGNTNNGIASFNANGSGFPFDEGILLTTGNSDEVPGPNGTGFASASNNGGWSEDKVKEIMNCYLQELIFM